MNECIRKILSNCEDYAKSLIRNYKEKSFEKLEEFYDKGFLTEFAYVTVHGYLSQYFSLD